MARNKKEDTIEMEYMGPRHNTWFCFVEDGLLIDSSEYCCFRLLARDSGDIVIYATHKQTGVIHEVLVTDDVKHAEKVFFGRIACSLMPKETRDYVVQQRKEGKQVEWYK